MIDKLKKQNGSALLITLLVMGVLITLALGLSELVIREIRITNDIVNSGKAFYAAEAGVESALLDLHQNLHGFEREDNMVKGELVVGNDEIDIKEELTFDYSIENLTSSIPFVDTKIIKKEIALGSPNKYLFNVLDLNENFTVPLFIQKDDGTIDNIKNFRVEYFIDAEIAPEWKQGVTNQVIDMLRWKITGINNSSSQNSSCLQYFDPNPNRLTTETIGDYLPAIEGTNNEFPSCFGTTSAGFTDNRSGINYEYKCSFLWEWAREAFIISRATGKTETEELATIEEFLTCHDTNYLTLTNIFNPSVLFGLSDFEKRNKAKIYYRILIPDEDEYVVRDFAKIKSTGQVRSSRKQIEAFIKPDSFMPVFNFSLYRTAVGGDNDKQNPQGYLEN